MAQATANIAKNVKRFREAAGRRQEDVARGAWLCGLDWGRSTVAMLEAGHYELKAVELLVLPTVLRLAEVGDFSLGDLLLPEDDEDVELTPNLRAEAGTLLKGLDPKKPQSRAGWHVEGYVKVRAIKAGEAEAKAARALGVGAEHVLQAGYALWGRTLSEERDVRVAEQAAPGTAPRSLQALRAHATRRLMAELAAELDRWFAEPPKSRRKKEKP